jgi:hypothetical protein
MREDMASFVLSSDNSVKMALLSDELVFVLYLSFNRSSTAHQELSWLNDR